MEEKRAQVQSQSHQDTPPPTITQSKSPPQEKIICHFIFSVVTISTSKRPSSGLDFSAFTNSQKMNCTESTILAQYQVK